MSERGVLREQDCSESGELTVVWIVGGIVGGLGGAYVSFTVDAVSTNHLPASTRMVVTLTLAAIAGVAGFLSGSTILRRASRDRAFLVPFSALAAGTAGGIIGLSQALGITITYLANYSTWPDAWSDQVLLVLSYPVFGALGFVVGALLGIVLGGLLGVVLRVVSPAR